MIFVSLFLDLMKRTRSTTGEGSTLQAVEDLIEIDLFVFTRAAPRHEPIGTNEHGTVAVQAIPGRPVVMHVLQSAGRFDAVVLDADRCSDSTPAQELRPDVALRSAK